MGPGSWNRATPRESWTVRCPVADAPLPAEVTLSAQGGTPPAEEVPLWKTAFPGAVPPPEYTTKLQSCAQVRLIWVSHAVHATFCCWHGPKGQPMRRQLAMAPLSYTKEHTPGAVTLSAQCT